MKKFLFGLLLSVICLFCAGGFTACDIHGTDNNNGEDVVATPTHTHTYVNGACVECGVLEPTDDIYFNFIPLSGTYAIEAKSKNNLPEEIVLPSTYNGIAVTSIGEGAFVGSCNLKSITIPDSVTSIARGAFYGEPWKISALTNINITDGNLNYKSIDGNLYSKDGKTLIQYAPGKTETEFMIPDNVTYISYGAFSHCYNLISIIIPDTVVKIEHKAFANCINLTNITMPDSITSIGINAFDCCHNLIYNKYSNGLYLGNKSNPFAVCIKAKAQDITFCVIHDDTKIIYDNAFQYCSGLRNITIGYSVETIGANAFADCLIENAKIPAIACSFIKNSDLKTVEITSGTNIGNYAFSGCSSLTSITIPDSVTSIGNSAFSDCTGLTSITIPDGVTSIGNYAFRSCTCNIEWGTNPSCIEIGDSAFSWYRGTSIKIPESVKSIGDYSFYHCSNLTNITIPDSVTSIGKWAFSECYRLKTITCDGNSSLTRIGTAAFYRCSSLTSVIFPDSVTSIGDDAFYNCSGLTSITIPNSVMSIGSSAFRGCSNLTSITIGNSVTSIGTAAFEYCSSLTSVTIGNSVKNIGEWAFYGCNGLTYNEYDNGLYLGNTDNSYLVLVKAKNTSITSCVIHSNTKIIYNAFSGCSSLTSITIPDSVTNIGEWAFYNCSSLTSVTIGNSVTSIGSYAFRGCSGLTSVIIPDSVTNIGEWAFYECSSLTSIMFNGTKGKWNSISEGNNWFYYVPANVVHCADGDVIV